MAAKRVPTQVERTHGHCADELMKDYGLPKNLHVQVCEQIAGVWKQNTMIHSLIIWSVRGYQPHAATRGLEVFLREHATHEPKNHKQTPVPKHEEREGLYVEPRYDRDYER
jgi:hypothetical protein